VPYVDRNIDQVAGFQNEDLPTLIKPQAGAAFEEQHAFPFVLISQSILNFNFILPNDKHSENFTPLISTWPGTAYVRVQEIEGVGRAGPARSRTLTTMKIES
jgi:hypothetical protein